jgi:hypothetical protein
METQIKQFVELSETILAFMKENKYVITGWKYFKSDLYYAFLGVYTSDDGKEGSMTFGKYPYQFKVTGYDKSVHFRYSETADTLQKLWEDSVKFFDSIKGEIEKGTPDETFAKIADLEA